MAVDWQTMPSFLSELPAVTVEYFLDDVCVRVWVGYRIGPFLFSWRVAGKVVHWGLCSGPGDGELLHMLGAGVSSSGPLARLLLSCFPLPRPLWPPLLQLLLAWVAQTPRTSPLVPAWSPLGVC